MSGNMSPWNAAFLLSHPDFARKVLRRPKLPSIIVMALKPVYAKAIYEGKKQWEFRKVPPPLFSQILIYESAPVSAVTGFVYFSESITGCSAVVWDMVRLNRIFTKNLTGIGLPQLRAYAGKHLVSALRVYEAVRFDSPVPWKANPPQNWGRYHYHPEVAKS